eukprot:scaffold255767_cov40-Prasinocladus_malaysianus.AAC.1
MAVSELIAPPVKAVTDMQDSQFKNNRQTYLLNYMMRQAVPLNTPGSSCECLPRILRIDDNPGIVMQRNFCSSIAASFQQAFQRVYDKTVLMLSYLSSPAPLRGVVGSIK